MTKRTKKAERFLAARASLYLAGAASAAFGVAGWLGSDPVSILLMGFTGLSALVVPFTIEIVGRDRWSALILAPALIFAAINAYSFHHAVEALIEAPRLAAHHDEQVAPLEADLATARAAVKAAQAAVVAHAAPVIPNTMGPKNTAARLAVWSTAHQPLTNALALAQASEVKAEAALKAAPAYHPLVSNEIVWALAAGLDISLAFGLAGIGMVRTRLDAKAKAERAMMKKRRKPAAKKPRFGKPKLAVNNS